MRVLIADDDEFARRMMEGILSRSGYQVQTARDGEAAWQILRSPDPPRLLLLDWLMPGFDGLEVCRKTRTILPRREAYIILVSAKTKPQEGLEAGADDFISKPVSPNELLAHVLRGKEALSQRATVTPSLVARGEVLPPAFTRGRRASAG